MSAAGKRSASLTVLFAAFLFVQYSLLGLGNRAGEGFLSTERRELVYYALQVLVIPGFLLYAALRPRLRSTRARRRFAAFLSAALLAGGETLLLADTASPFYLAVTFAVMPFLGCLGGAVYHRMSRETGAGERTALCMGLGAAAAVPAHYVLLLRRSPAPLAALALAAALALLGYLLPRPAAAPEPERRGADPAPARRVCFTCLITLSFLFFVSFYNGYIHHLQILSGYGAYNAYSWPRLLMVPCYLLFAALGDRRQGRLVPLTALCVMLASMLNAVLAGSGRSYWLNMCLFYCAVAACAAYYNLSFWRLAGETRRPGLWASMGRVLDSGAVLVSGALRVSALPPAAVLGANLAGLAGVIVLMSVNGDLSLSPPAPHPEPLPAPGGAEPLSAPADSLPVPPEPAPAVPGAASGLLSAGEALERMGERYGLTPRETEVLRELVSTEDKQTAIGERLNIQVKTLQKHITRLYQKTGAATRSGLAELYHEIRAGL